METRAGDVRGRVLLILATIGAVACIALGAAFGFSVRGYPVDDLAVLTLGVSVVALLSLLLIAALVYLWSEVSRRHFRLTALLPPIVIVVGVVLGWRAPRFVASRQPYWAEKVFWTHHEEFVELAEWASDECSEDDDFPLDAASFYEDAWALCTSSGLEEIEFTIRRAQHMVVFTPVESQDDAYDPCFQSHARYLIKKLEDHWYLCGWTTD